MISRPRKRVLGRQLTVSSTGLSSSPQHAQAIALSLLFRQSPCVHRLLKTAAVIHIAEQAAAVPVATQSDSLHSGFANNAPDAANPTRRIAISVATATMIEAKATTARHAYTSETGFPDAFTLVSR